MTVVLLELLCVVGFCGAELFFLLSGLRLISRVSVIFICYLLTPPDIINYIRNAYYFQFAK